MLVIMKLPLHKEDVSNLDEYLEESITDNALHFLKKDNNYFYHKDDKVDTYTYISFADAYKFEICPDGFTYELVNGKSYLSKKLIL